MTAKRRTRNATSTGCFGCALCVVNSLGRE